MISDRPVPAATPRKAMTMRRKLAACLAQMRHPKDASQPLVPGADRLTEDEIIAAVQFDHFIPLELGGRDHASNVHPLPVREHIEVKTPLDRRMIDKARRNRAAETEFRAKLLAKSNGDDPPRNIKKRHWPQRRFQSRRDRNRGGQGDAVRTD